MLAFEKESTTGGEVISDAGQSADLSAAQNVPLKQLFGTKVLSKTIITEEIVTEEIITKKVVVHKGPHMNEIGDENDKSDFKPKRTDEVRKQVDLSLVQPRYMNEKCKERYFEGTLLREVEKKTYCKVFCLVRGTLMILFKDKAPPANSEHDIAPDLSIDLSEAECEIFPQ